MKRLVVASLVLTLGACATEPGARDTQQNAGATVAGVVVGGLVGSAFGGGTGKVLMTAAGAVAGGFVGNHLYKKHADSEYEKDAAQRALNDAPSGQTVRWSDPRTREDLLRVARQVEAEPSIRGASAHLLAVARRPSMDHPTAR